jgi:hypothetical protein
MTDVLDPIQVVIGFQNETTVVPSPSHGEMISELANLRFAYADDEKYWSEAWMIKT